MPGKSRKMIVKGVRKTEPDLEKLGIAFLMLAQAIHEENLRSQAPDTGVGDEDA